MNIQAMMKQAKKMQDQLEVSKKELEKKEFTIEKQGIKIVVLGNRRIKKIDINEALIDPEDKDIIEDLIIIAFNEAQDIIDGEESKMQPSSPAGMPF